MDWLKQLHHPSYWLLAIAATLVTLHLTILEQANEPNLLTMSLLFWLAIASLMWDKRDKLKLDSGIFSSFLGATLITFVLLRSLSPAGYHKLVSPFISGMGLCLMASSIKRLHEYWKELSILGLLVLYPALSGFLNAIDLTTLTAKLSTFILWATGFRAEREGVLIFLPTGRVEVYGACSGIEIIILMFSLAILFWLLVPLSRLQLALCITVATLLGFIVNALRVSLLAILVANSSQNAFNFWHDGAGSSIFSILAVCLFGLFCWLFYVRKLQNIPEPGDSHSLATVQSLVTRFNVD
jgi:cyanoexosortase A